VTKPACMWVGAAARPGAEVGGGGGGGDGGSGGGAGSSFTRVTPEEAPAPPAAGASWLGEGAVGCVGAAARAASDAGAGTLAGGSREEAAPAITTRTTGSPWKASVVDLLRFLFHLHFLLVLVGRGLHSLTSELNLRPYGTHRSRQSST